MGQRLRHGAQHPQPCGRLPDQGEVEQPGDGDGHGPGTGVHDLGQAGLGGRADDDERVEDGELGTRQLVQGAQQRGSGRGARRQLARVVRRRRGEVGAGDEQA